MRLTVEDLVEKRRKRWEELRDIEFDRKLVRAAVQAIMGSPALLVQIRARPYLLIEVAFSVVDKERNTVPFFLNEVQRDFIRELETRGTEKPYFILKGRQQGFTTLITAMQLSYAITRRNFSGFTIAHRRDSTKAIFNDKARVVYNRLPDLLKPREKYNSADELFFDKLNSSWRVETASEDVARGMTLNFVHLSEVAFYTGTFALLQASVGEALVADAIQIYETTANGFNHARELWVSGSCYNLFYGWWRTPEYRCTEYAYLENTDPWLTERLHLLSERGLEREQLCWYAKKYVGYLDKSLIKQEYPCTPEEAFISGGECVFDKEALEAQILRVEALTPARVGYFRYKRFGKEIRNVDGEIEEVEWQITDIEFVDDRNGYITLHELPRSKKDREGTVTAYAPYVIGGDTAGKGADYFTAKVICNLDHRTVATLRKRRIDEDLYSEQIYCLGKYYNDALIGIETNYSRQPMRLLYQKYGYPNLYLRERIDRMADTVEKVFGFETTAKTKPVIISELVERMREDPGIEVDMETLREMTVFVKKDNGKQEAQEGQHDDLVMALAIAHFISGQQKATWIPAVAAEDDFLERNFRAEQAETTFMDW